MKKIILDILDYLFARKILLPINIIILKLVIRFIGYNNHKSLRSSGEKNFLNNVCKNKPQLCIDVGANIGEYSKYILENSNSRVIAFEPVPESFNKLNLLKKKLRLKGVLNFDFQLLLEQFLHLLHHKNYLR